MAAPKATIASLLGLAALSVAAASSMSSTASARRTTVETMPVSEIKPGMKGHAVTVFQGDQTDKFEIEIVDVIPNYLPKQDAVLFKSNDPRMTHSGIVGGMSGSPIYIDGKLVGALSYGWRFNKDALGALTPIENMKSVGALPYRPDVLPHPKSGKSRKGTRAWADTMLGLDTSPLPPRRRPQELDPVESLAPLAVPMSVSGLGSESTRMLVDAFGFTPVRGGSLGGESSSDIPPKQWKGGDAVSVVLIEGDSSVASNGTVTWVSPKGDRLLAFGHSMFDDGPTNVPMADARVHTIISSVERSVKVSSPRTIRGLMYQDRQAAIALRTDARAPMIPVHTTIQGPDPDLPARTYDNRVAVGVDLTPNLVAVILAEAVDEAGRDATEVVLDLEHSITVETSKGVREIQLDEEVFFASGIIGRMMGQSRGIATVAAVLDNDFEVGRIVGIEHEIRMEYGAPVESLETVRLPEEEVRAGEVVRLEVVLRDRRGESRTEILPLRIPDDASGQQVQIEVAAGDLVRPYRPLPGDLDDLLGSLEAGYPSRSMVATVYREGEGLSTRHGLMPSLPDSVLETLKDRGGTRDSVRLKQMSRRVIPTKNLIEGVHTVQVEVLPPKSF